MTENLNYYPRHGFQETHRGGEDGYRRVYYQRAVKSRATTSPSVISPVSSKPID